MRFLAVALIAPAAFGTWANVDLASPLRAASIDDACTGIAALDRLDLIALPMSFVVRDKVVSAGIEVRSRTINAYLGKGWHAGGLASFKFAYTPTTVFRERVVGSQACVGLQSLSITYGYPQPVEILVANRYPEGSCQYEEILRHEFEHYEIYRSSAFDGADAKAKALRSYVEARLPVRAPSRSQAEAIVDTIVNEAVRSMAAQVSSDARARNAAIDNPENYERITALCPPHATR